MAVKPSHEKLVSVEKLSILALATLLLFIFQSTPPNRFIPSVGLLEFSADRCNVDLQLSLLLCHFLTQRVALLHFC